MRILSLGLVLVLLSGCCCARTSCCDVGAIDMPPPAPVPPPEKDVPEEVVPLAPILPNPELVKVLEKKRMKGLHWEDAKLETAVMYLRTVTGVNFFVTSRAREAMGDQLITFKADDVSIKFVLDAVTESYGLAWDTRGDVVRITATSESQTAMRLRYYDLKDLVGEHGDVRAKIEAAVEPAIWSHESTALESRNGILIARAPLYVLEAIDTYLSNLRKQSEKAAKSDKGWAPIR